MAVLHLARCDLTAAYPLWTGNKPDGENLSGCGSGHSPVRSFLPTADAFLDPKDAPYVGFEPDSEDADQPAEALTTAYSFPDSVSPLVRSLRLIWLLVALGMLIRKITVYQSFLRYIHAGLTPVSDLKV